VAGRIGEAGIVASDAARAGEGATSAARAATRTLTRHGEAPPARVLRVGEDRTKVNLLASKNAGVRLAQHGYDRMVQRSLDPEAAAAYHYGQARKGVSAKRNMALGKIYERVAQKNLVHVDESLPAGAKVHINPAHGRLARVDEQLARVQQRGDTILAEHGVMTP